ncbi:hypothetical protein [Sinorhizobium fredii]|uniref:hypothetical protein n=1 Tax=Rhizobium fredii TaxID=380 RepID=UPI0004ACD2E6|nr:hypothetical protein [Sinorhizobium fredii]
MAILPDFSAATFIPGAPINNPYLPLIPGHVLSYKGDEIAPETGDITRETTSSPPRQRSKYAESPRR